MTRRNLDVLAGIIALVGFLLLIIGLCTWLAKLTDTHPGHVQPVPRPVPHTASRFLVRSFLTVPPSDHAAAGRDTEGPVDDPGKALAGPTAIADRHGTLKQRIAWCESRGDVDAINPVSGASGVWQFLRSTWHEVTGLPGKASDYPLSVQSEAFDELFAQQGTRPWLASAKCWRKP